ncbi:MAG: succinylglutamate desuccinylase/aspartoacylase family protein [archaeon]|nr:succinylglutamate desuccinylase/aspartoacylase family protein [archaeon]MCR4323488.1 succinylglutamate desuccinylase/aspartoacylase family protein [Nanoarchaeota archaeon]
MNNIKVIEKIGKNPGKTSVVLAGVHGNEVGNIKLFDRIITTIEISNGKVIFIYANLEAIKEGKRFIGMNLNRAFMKELPEKLSNTLEAKTAREIIPYLNEADFLLDLHASNSMDSKPFIVCEPQSLEFAKSMPCKLITTNWDGFEPGSTEYWMNLQNKIAMGFEGGYLGDSESEKRAEAALMNFLIKAENIEGTIEPTQKKEYLKIIFLYKNKTSPFIKTRDFADFEKMEEKTLVGKEGEKEVYAERGDILIFVRDRKDLNEECFLIAKEMEVKR